MVTARKSLLAFQNMYKYARSKLVTAVVLEGCSSMEKLKQTVESTMRTVNPITGDIFYPEISQKYTIDGLSILETSGKLSY
jgi:hypothetical protein